MVRGIAARNNRRFQTEETRFSNSRTRAKQKRSSYVRYDARYDARERSERGDDTCSESMIYSRSLPLVILLPFFHHVSIGVDC